MEKKKETAQVKAPKVKVKHASLNEAMLAIMEEVDYIKRKGHNTAQNFKYASAEQIIHEIREAALKHGVRIAAGYSDAVELPAGETKNGSAMYRVRVKGVLDLIHDQERESHAFYGEGADTGDKATAKALTACLKQGLRQVFLIETGDDDPDKANPEGKESFEEIMAAMPKKQAEEITDGFGWLKKRKFEDLSKPAFRNAVMQVIEANERDPERIIGYLRDHGWKGNVIASDMALEKMQ